MMCRCRFFTMVELLATIAIIAVVAGIVLGGMNFAARRADEAKTLAIMAEFEMALDAFKHDNGYYPPCATASDIKYKLNSSGKVNIVLGSDYLFENAQGRAYMELGQITTAPQNFVDAWGNALQYQCPGTNNPQSYDLWSKGAKTGNTADDIGNWQKR
jgi:prepilin-type N-terminal cleavage/methylation domain-containing protein